MIAASIGIALHVALTLVLSAICMFDDGVLLADWARECVAPISILASPLVVAFVGSVRRSVGWLTGAAALSALVALVFIAGAGMLLFVPSVCYGIGAGTVGRVAGEPRG